MNSGSDAIKNNCIPYAVKGRVYSKGRITVHNMLVDDKNFCITFTFEWTF